MQNRLRPLSKWTALSYLLELFRDIKFILWFFHSPFRKTAFWEKHGQQLIGLIILSWLDYLINFLLSPCGQVYTLIFVFLFVAFPFNPLVFTAGNWSFSWKWTRYTYCNWCCSKRPWYCRCSNCCSLSTATFSWSKLILGCFLTHFFKILTLFQLSVNYAFVRFMFIEVEELLELTLMGAVLL